MAGQLIALFKWRMDAYVVMPALMLVIAVPAGLGVRRGKQSAANALLPLGLFLLAFAFRQADVERLLCWLGSGVFQGHALWHGLTAASLWMMLIALLMPSTIPTAHRSPLFSVTPYAKRGVQNGATSLDNGWALRTDGYPQGGQRSRNAAALGATALEPGPESFGVVREETRGGVSSVFEASGVKPAMDSTLRLVQPGGTISLIGVPQGGRRGLPALRLARRRRREDHDRGGRVLKRPRPGWWAFSIFEAA